MDADDQLVVVRALDTGAVLSLHYRGGREGTGLMWGDHRYDGGYEDHREHRYPQMVDSNSSAPPDEGEFRVKIEVQSRLPQTS